MEHTNEFLMGMFAAYMGCEVKDTRQNRIGNVNSINKTRVWYEYMNNNVVKSPIQNFAFYGEIKPILTPLSEITDEDAVEVAKIMLKKEDNWIPVRIERNEAYIEVVTKEEPDILDEEATITMLVRFWIQDNKIAWVWEYQRDNKVGIDDRRVPNIQHIIDYLRKKKYDCGYLHISSLIKAGLAVKSTK
jgi:hypothetical protein